MPATALMVPQREGNAVLTDLHICLLLVSISTNTCYYISLYIYEQKEMIWLYKSHRCQASVVADEVPLQAAARHRLQELGGCAPLRSSLAGGDAGAIGHKVRLRGSQQVERSRPQALLGTGVHQAVQADDVRAKRTMSHRGQQLGRISPRLAREHRVVVDHIGFQQRT